MKTMYYKQISLSLRMAATDVLILLSILVTLTLATKPNTNRLTLNLIHRFSPASPTYDRNYTFVEFLERNAAYIYQRLAYQEQDINAVASLAPIPNENLFLVRFSIGRPAVQQFAVLDTGSSKIWVICKRGRPYFQNWSPTYRSVSCDECDEEIFKCRNTSMCFYEEDYSSGEFSVGYVGYETFVFETAEKLGTMIVTNVMFGCAVDVKGYIFDNYAVDGIFGLGPRPGLSFVDKLKDLGSTQFSYCIGSVTDSSYAFNKLHLGVGADMGGDTTPLDINSRHYGLSLESLSFGAKPLHIDPDLFVREGDDWTSGVIIDTGSLYTILPDDAYRPVYNAVTNLLDPEFTRRNRGFLRLCYEGRVEDLINFPVLVFYFAEGASLELGTTSLFYQGLGNEFCLAIARSATPNNPYNKLTIIGLMAQQHYSVGYDLQELRLSLRRTDCKNVSGGGN